VNIYIFLGLVLMGAVFAVVFGYSIGAFDVIAHYMAGNESS